MYLTSYLYSYNNKNIRNALARPLIGDSLEDYPILCFAVARNSPQIVRLLCKSGADPNSVMGVEDVPMLSYAVVSADYSLSDTTDTVIALLAMGAKPTGVPKDMWKDYLSSPAKDLPKDLDKEDWEDRWCIPEIREALSRTLTLKHHYSLWKASSMQHPSPVMKQVTEATNAVPLLEIDYHVIG